MMTIMRPIKAQGMPSGEALGETATKASACVNYVNNFGRETEGNRSFEEFSLMVKHCCRRLRKHVDEVCDDLAVIFHDQDEAYRARAYWRRECTGLERMVRDCENLLYHPAGALRQGNVQEAYETLRAVYGHPTAYQNSGLMQPLKLLSANLLRVVYDEREKESQPVHESLGKRMGASIAHFLLRKRYRRQEQDEEREKSVAERVEELKQQMDDPADLLSALEKEFPSPGGIKGYDTQLRYSPALYEATSEAEAKLLDEADTLCEIVENQVKTAKTVNQLRKESESSLARLQVIRRHVPLAGYPLFELVTYFPSEHLERLRKKGDYSTAMKDLKMFVSRLPWVQSPAIQRIYQDLTGGYKYQLDKVRGHTCQVDKMHRELYKDPSVDRSLSLFYKDDGTYAKQEERERAPWTPFQQRVYEERESKNNALKKRLKGMIDRVARLPRKAIVTGILLGIPPLLGVSALYYDANAPFPHRMEVRLADIPEDYVHSPSSLILGQGPYRREEVACGYFNNAEDRRTTLVIREGGALRQEITCVGQRAVGLHTRCTEEKPSEYSARFFHNRMRGPIEIRDCATGKNRIWHLDEGRPIKK